MYIILQEITKREGGNINAQYRESAGFRDL